MDTSGVFLVLAAFLAAAVEMVEALTIVLAVGVTRGWRSTLIGVGAATGALAVVIAVLGPALTVIPIDGLRLVIGTLLLIFGLQWLRKAVLRASGYKAQRDEAAMYERELADARAARGERRAGLDWYSFTLSFKGVFLEGLEVAFIVLTFGSSQGSIPLAALGAALGLIVVVAVGAVVHAPLSRVPENAMKFAVGIMLSTFGVFWVVEGAGIDWPGGDLSIVGILIFMLAIAFGNVSLLRARRDRRLATTSLA